MEQTRFSCALGNLIAGVLIVTLGLCGVFHGSFETFMQGVATVCAVNFWVGIFLIDN